MPRRPSLRGWNPKQPHPFAPYERIVQALAAGVPHAKAYSDEGYSKRTALKSCKALLATRANGVQARLDAVVERMADDIHHAELNQRIRRLETLDARQDEVNNRLDLLWQYATEKRARITPQGQKVLDENGQPILEMVSITTAEKVVTMLAIDAGLQVRQSKSGKMAEDYGDLSDERLAEVLAGQLKELGFGVHKIEPEGGVAPPPKLKAV